MCQSSRKKRKLVDEDDEDSQSEKAKAKINEKPNNSYAFRTMKSRKGQENDATETSKSAPAKLRTLNVWFIKDRFVGFNNET